MVIVFVKCTMEWYTIGLEQELLQRIYSGDAEGSINAVGKIWIVEDNI